MGHGATAVSGQVGSDAGPDAHVRVAVLELAGVSRLHAGRPVWAPVDLRVASGSLCIVTGDNGSGKTTLLRLAAGLLRPSTGSRICTGRALYVRAGAGLRGVQTVAGAVATTAGLAGRRSAATAALAVLGLDGSATRRVGTLSAGERVRVTLAAALAAQPSLLCLDEPTGVLDERGVDDLLAVLRQLRAGGCAVLLATHQPAAVLAGADAHLHLAGGRVSLHDPVSA
ncbi:MAG: ATP-binding cassette domain-containing protein [Actinobacteria bacterium]|nr:ATP-binding cassette domain-containing protein [Actinomycetota bacterium]